MPLADSETPVQFKLHQEQEPILVYGRIRTTRSW